MYANKFLGERYPALKKISLMTYNAEKKILHRYLYTSREVWEKILPIQTKPVKSPTPHSPTNVQWSCQPFSGWGKKRIWHLCKCHPSTKWLARDHDVVVFKTKVLHFKIENTPIKDTSGKRKFKRMLSFLSVDKRKLFAMKLSFEEFNLVSTRRIGALGLFWTNQGSEVSEDTWGTFRTLWLKKTFSTFWHRRERKTTKCAFEIDFFNMYSTDLTCMRERNDLTCLTRIACYD